jgi:hypothetical protein
MVFFAPALLAFQPDLVVPTAGMVISESVVFAPGEYVLDGGKNDWASPAITIEGSGITVDFNGAVIRCSSAEIEPNEREGVGVLVTGKNSIIRGANVHGAKVGLLARDADGLKILDSDFSYNWKQLLGSTPEREDPADWMSYHQNEEDEWLRFGAGIYLDDCDGAQVKRTKIVGGQNGLLMTETDSSLVMDCNFSFLSSLGIGMYRSSLNKIMHNRIDWCVRGFSYQVYNRGQDSAGILVYEQSSSNTFAYNSVTHGGDGFFLWAGQSTMDTGKGGCNDNLLYGNDFSHAPTNGIEATFSRNAFINNLMMECWHGIWGGYSYDSLVHSCVFAHNAEAIAWEHGQRVRIEESFFDRNRKALVMWTKESEDPNWGYPKHRDTDSHGSRVVGSFFRDTADTVFDLRRVKDIQVLKSQIGGAGQLASADAATDLALAATGVSGVDSQPDQPGVKAMPEIKAGRGPLKATMDPAGRVIHGADESAFGYQYRFGVPWRALQRPTKSMTAAAEKYRGSLPKIPSPVTGALDPFLKAGTLRGRRYIFVDEWGPYDFQRPLLVPRHETGDEIRFEILGPEGTWSVRALSEGLTLSADGGRVPGLVTATLAPGFALSSVDLTYTGGETTDYRGRVSAAGDEVGCSWTRFTAPISWTTRFWTYDGETQDPREQEAAFMTIFDADPAAVVEPVRLDFSWPGSPAEGVPTNHFATESVGLITAPAGDYELTLTSDDGVRVWLDGELIFEDWTWHAPKTDKIKVSLDGAHELRILHFELDGYSALKADIKPSR